MPCSPDVVSACVLHYSQSQSDLFEVSPSPSPSQTLYESQVDPVVTGGGGVCDVGRWIRSRCWSGQVVVSTSMEQGEEVVVRDQDQDVLKSSAIS